MCQQITAGLPSVLLQPPPAADPCPQAAGCLGDAGAAGQAQAPQGPPNAGQHPWLLGGSQLLQGSLVYPAQLLAVELPEVAELFCRRLRDD